MDFATLGSAGLQSASMAVLGVDAWSNVALRRTNDERMLALTLRMVARSVPTQSVTSAGN
jgi:hypothetical protein